MRIEFDPAKDATNREKHGVSLMQALALDWESALARVNDRREVKKYVRQTQVP